MNLGQRKGSPSGSLGAYQNRSTLQEEMGEMVDLEWVWVRTSVSCQRTQNLGRHVEIMVDVRSAQKPVNIWRKCEHKTNTYRGCSSTCFEAELT